MLSYLAAAVFGARWVGWGAAATLAALVVAAGLVGVPQLIVFIVIGVALGTVGLVVRPESTRPQALAAIGYLGAGTIALVLLPPLGLVLAGAALAAHAVWDFLHYRRDAVVKRSLTLWCMGLDLVVGVAAIVVGVTA